MAKKKAKKNVKKKKSRKKATAVKKAKRKKAKKKRTGKMTIVGLQNKRFEVMKAVPIVPCSVISKDPQGLQYAHTQAEKIFRIYRAELIKQRITPPTLIKCVTATVLVKKLSTGEEFYSSRATCTFRISDADNPNDYDDVQSTALGCNDVWSDNSAQTVAEKQMVLQYFIAAWPQPTNYVVVVRESLNELPPEDFKQAVRQMMPEKIMTSEGAVNALEAFFDAMLKK